MIGYSMSKKDVQELRIPRSIKLNDSIITLLNGAYFF